MSALTVTHSRRQFKFRWSRFFIYLVLIISVVFFLVPIYLLLITSFKSYQEVNMANMWNSRSNSASNRSNTHGLALKQAATAGSLVIL